MQYLFIILVLIWNFLSWIVPLLVRFVISVFKTVFHILELMLTGLIHIPEQGMTAWAFLGILSILLALGIIGYCAVDQIIREKNGKALKRYLDENCHECGYVNAYTWGKTLPQFAEKKYSKDESFHSITSEFARSMEAKYVSGQRDEWMHAIIEYLTSHLMADTQELVTVFRNNFKYTHVTPSVQIVHDGMEALLKEEQRDGKRIIEKIPLDEEAVKEMYPALGKNLPKEYLTAYKISDRFISVEDMNQGNLESREMSLDDLGII